CPSRSYWRERPGFTRQFSRRFSRAGEVMKRRFTSKLGKGFTLVELLVVIGIIAVLLSILLPTLGKVRRQAYTLQCASNMRQLSMAMLMYIGDNKGRFPAAEFSTIAGVYPYGWWWPNELVRL